MTTPPFYEDLGKASRDVFNKGYGEDSFFVKFFE